MRYCSCLHVQLSCTCILLFLLKFKLIQCFIYIIMSGEKLLINSHYDCVRLWHFQILIAVSIYYDAMTMHWVCPIAVFNQLDLVTMLYHWHFSRMRFNNMAASSAMLHSCFAILIQAVSNYICEAVDCCHCKVLQTGL